MFYKKSILISRPPIDEREILWEKRHYLHDRPEALPKVLLAAHSWDWACLPDLHASLRVWSSLPPIQALQLLLPWYVFVGNYFSIIGFLKRTRNIS